MKIFLSAILFIVVTQAILPAQTYHFNKLTVEEGLNDGDIHTIGQDKYGYMWFGSLGGLNRFNGRSVEWFTNIPGDSTTPLASLPQSMACDRNGRLWIGFETGLMEYVYETSSFRRVATGGDTWVSQLLPVSGTTMYLVTDKGLARMNTRTGRVVFYKDVVSDPTQKALFGARFFSMVLCRKYLYLAGRKDVFVFDTEAETIRKTAIPLLEGSRLSSLAVDSYNNLWIGAYGRVQLLKVPFSPLSGEITAGSAVCYDRFLSSSQQMIYNNVNVVQTGAEGKMWVATTLDGLLEYIPANDSFRRHVYIPTLPGSPSGNLHRCMFRDREGLIWLGGHQGLNYFNPSQTLFTTILPFGDQLDVRHRTVARAVTEDHLGNLWFATLDGISRYSTNAQTYREWNNRLGKEPVLWSNSVRGIRTDCEENVWIATGGGVNRYLPRQNRMEFVKTTALPAAFYFFIGEDRENRLWFCTRDFDGFYWYEPSDGSFHGISEHPDLKVFTGLGGRCFLQDSRGRYWLGFNGSGLGMYDPATRKVRRWTTEDNPATIAGSRIIDIKEDKGGWIWVSTPSGITGIDADRNYFRSFAAKDGLLSNTAAALGVDALNRLWVGTTRGITMIDNSRTVFTPLGIQDGLPAATFFEHAGYQARDGDFIFPSVNGYVKFNPLRFRENVRQVPCYLSGVKVLDENYPLKGQGYNLKELYFKPGENTFTLELTAVHFENPGQIRYAFMLEGIDRQWTYTQQHQARYLRVPAGNYTFRFKATANPSDWNVPEKSVAITVEAVFYRTTWFLLLSLAFASMGLYGIYRYRTRQQLRLALLQGRSQLLEKEKALVMYENLKQQLNPHFLFNSLTSLRSLIRVMPDRAGEFLDGLSRIYRYILQNREKETVPLAEEIAFAQTYVKLQQTRFPGGFEVNIAISQADMDKKIAPVTLQNLIENAIKHNLIDSESPLVVDIFTEGDYLVVRNNLQLKEFVETSNRQGLQHLRSLYVYLSALPLVAGNEGGYYVVKVPLILWKHA